MNPALQQKTKKVLSVTLVALLGIAILFTSSLFIQVSQLGKSIKLLQELEDNGHIASPPSTFED